MSFLNEDVRFLICRFLPVKDFKEFCLINKQVFQPLEEYPFPIVLLDKSLENENLDFTLKQLQRHQKIDPSIKFVRGLTFQTALNSSCLLGHFPLFEFLLHHPKIDPSTENNEAIKSASKFGNFNIVYRLLEDQRVDPSVGDNFPIRYASSNGHFDIVCRLLEDFRVDPSADNNYAIRYSSSIGHFDIVCRLLGDSRVDPSVLGNQAIRYASAGYFDVVCRLLEDYRVNPSALGNHAAHNASSNGLFDVFERLKLNPRVSV